MHIKGKNEISVISKVTLSFLKWPLSSQSYEKWKEVNCLQEMSRFFISPVAVGLSCFLFRHFLFFPQKIFQFPFFFSLLGKVSLHLWNNTLTTVIVCNWLNWFRNVQTYIVVCLSTVLCIYSNWQKK